MVEFYEKYIPSVKGMPSLSLSTYWEDIAQLMKDLDGVNSSPVRSLVGIPAVEVQGEEGSSTEVKRGDNIVSSIPELDYLKHDERIDQKHDPLQLVQNIYGAAAAFTSDASPYSKSVLLSACLALAVKSGRASLMLHLSSILASFSQGSTDGEGQYISIDMDPLKDVCEHLLAHRDAQNSAKSTTQSCPSPNIVKNVEQEHLSAACTVFERDPLSSAAASAATGGRGGACEGEVASADQPHKGLLLSFGKADHGMNICL